jgi:uncharacterized membrane protein YgcG
MKSFVRMCECAGPHLVKQILSVAMSLALLSATWPQSLAAYQDAQNQGQDQQQQQGQPSQPPYAQQTPEQLQQLVAPIALYPDSLVAQILAAATFPDQVVEADRWLQANPNLKGDALAKAVDQQPWDPSVKALTAFPNVLGNMDKNLSWTSSLGDAYYNQQQDVMDAIQVMRQKAQQAGNLQSTPQQTVTTQGSTIVIQPAQPDVVYVPAYNPWVVYGYPVAPWPYWYPYPGIWFGGPSLFFGVGFGVGWFGGFGWGWGHWGGFNWYNHYAIYNNNRYYSRSTTFYNRNTYYRGGGEHGVASNVNRGFNRPGGNVYNRPGASPRPFEGNQQAARGYAQPRGQSDTRTGAFSNYDHGGESRSYSSRGAQSFGGGGGFHGGGGGGGSHGGGGRPR